MADPFDDLDEQIEAELAHATRDVEQVAIAATFEVLANLVEDTPVDTRHAAANWVPSRSAPFMDEDGEQTRSEYRRGVEVNRGSTTAGGAQETGRADVLEYTLEDGDLYVTNNVPYMVGPGSLNDGHSSQQPAGFIENAVERACQTIEEEYGAEASFHAVADIEER